MTTTFTSLPILDLSPLQSPAPSPTDLTTLAAKLHDIFKTVGFAYLINPPLSFTQDQVFSIAQRFFALPITDKMSVAKTSFVRSHRNTYRGYFPAQPGMQDNLKEGFEIGPTPAPPPSSFPDSHKDRSPINLTEPNVFPDTGMALTTQRLHSELQSLSTTLLSLLAISLDKDPSAFTDLLKNSISTLRLLHYPAQPSSSSSSSTNQSTYDPTHPPLTCTPHTDSGLLTLLFQDATGGLEVLNSSGSWIPAPHLPGSLVVNIGDLMARLSGGAFVATMHRVRRSESGRGRYSVPFFCEPGVDAEVPGEGEGERAMVRYGEFVRGKMGGWVEFQDVEEVEEGGWAWEGKGVQVEVGA